MFGLAHCIVLNIYFLNRLVSSGIFYAGKDIKLFISDGRIKLGKRIRLSDHVHLHYSGNLTIGAHTTINSYSRIISFDSIEIGSNCAIASFVTVLDHDHNYEFEDGKLELNGYVKEPVTIGSNVCIGDKVTIFKGVTIGDNVVIGANSLVNTDIHPNGIAAGVPCKMLKTLQD